MQRLRIGALAAALVAATTLVATGSAGVAAPKATTIVFGAEQSPECWNVLLADCNLFWSGILTGPVLQGAYAVYPDLSKQPQLVSGADVTTKPFTVTYHIRPEAHWNDGKQVSANDFIFTWKTYMNPKNNVISRSGYDKITRAQAINQKTVKFFFKAPYAPWKGLFGSGYPLMPAHALQGENFNKVFSKDLLNPKTKKPISNGPYLFSRWVQDQQFVLVKNPNYWGWSPTGKKAQAKIDRIVFKFVTDTNSEIQCMKSGECDMIYPQPQLALADLRGQSGIGIQSSAGPVLEGLTYNLLAPKAGTPWLRPPWVRQAIQYSIDRTAVVKQLFKTLKPNLTPLNSNIYIQNQKDYKPFFNIFKYDPGKVTQIMSSHGCNKGGDGIWVCQGSRMSFNFGTTAGNKLRELSFEIMQAQAKQAGFELKAAFQPAGVFFSADGVFGQNFQIALYADVASGDPGDFTSSFSCGGENNYGKYCSQPVTNALKAADEELDPAKRAALVNKAVKLMSANTPRFPLYQKPTFLVYKTKIKGLKDNPSLQGPTWNVMDWSLG
jgi:peptide/nickel transport system substrate-binding protein